LVIKRFQNFNISRPE